MGSGSRGREGDGEGVEAEAGEGDWGVGEAGEGGVEGDEKNWQEEKSRGSERVKWTHREEEERTNHR